MQFVQLLLRKLHFLNASRTASRSASFLRRSPEIRDSRGFGLIEVIVVVAIISIVALGIATMMQDMFSQQQRAAQKGVLNSTRARLIETLQNPTSWAATVAHADNNAYLSCLRTGGVCNNNQTSGLNLVDSSGAVIYPSATATAGYRPDGTNCNTFSAGTPDPACPFRWAITWQGFCPGGNATCESPDIQLTGTFQYSAGATGFGAGFNPNTYNFSFRRGSDVVLNQVVTFRYVENDNTGEEAISGQTDSCKNAWVVRRLNQITDAQNTGASLDVSATATNSRFTLPAGTYNCRVLVPAFKSGGNRIQLYRYTGTAGAVGESPVTIAQLNPGGSVVNSIEQTIRLNAAATFAVLHYCTQQPADDTDTYGSVNNRFSRGVPVPLSAGVYTGTTYTTVTCIRTGA